MASDTIVTFNGLRCTKVPKINILVTESLMSPATAQAAVTEQPSPSSSGNTASAVEAGPLSAVTASSVINTNLDSSTSISAEAPSSSNSTHIVSATEVPAQTSTISPDAGPSPSADPQQAATGSSHSSIVPAAVGGALGGAAVIGLALLIYFLIRRRKAPSPPFEFYSGEKYDQASQTARNSPRNIIATIMISLASVAQAVKDATMPTVQRPRISSSSSRWTIMPFKLFRKREPPDLMDETDNTSHPDTSAVAAGPPRLDNPFVDPPTSPNEAGAPRDPTRMENPFIDPSHGLDFDFGPSWREPQTASDRYSNSNYSSNLSGTIIRLPSTDSRSPPGQMTNADLDRWRRERDLVRRPSSTYSDPFDLERPPTVYATNK